MIQPPKILKVSTMRDVVTFSVEYGPGRLWLSIHRELPNSWTVKTIAASGRTGDFFTVPFDNVFTRITAYIEGTGERSTEVEVWSGSVGMTVGRPTVMPDARFAKLRSMLQQALDTLP